MMRKTSVSKEKLSVRKEAEIKPVWPFLPVKK
jgi:hypothetical protein